MAFELDPALPLPRALRHIALEELRDALAALKRGEPRDIHEVRKSTKRLRAWLRLLRPMLDTDYVVLNRLLRDAARAVAGSRERDVARLTLRAVLRPLRLPHQDTVAVRAGLLAHLPAETPRQRAAGRKMSAQLLVVARLYLHRASLAGADPRRLDKGLRASQRRCRTAYTRARRKPTPQRLHEWRKLAKYRRYQLALLGPFAPRSGAERRVLKRLSDALGHHHDLFMLARAVRRLEHPLRDPLLLEILARQRRLEQRALRIGRRLSKGGRP